MTEHGALGTTGRAGGIQHRGQTAGVGGTGGRLGAAGHQRVDLGAGVAVLTDADRKAHARRRLARSGGRLGELPRIEQAAGTRIVQDETDRARVEHEVDRHHGGAGLEDGQVGHDEFGAVEAKQADAIARLRAEFNETAGDGIRCLIEP